MMFAVYLTKRASVSVSAVALPKSHDPHSGLSTQTTVSDSVAKWLPKASAAQSKI
jgi:hypothetical protein